MCQARGKTMRKIMGLIVAVAVAGCGNNNSTCGASGQDCCANNTCMAAGTTCQSGKCMPPPMCGKSGLMCCTGNTCTDGSACMNGTCMMMQMQCGNSGQPCCTTMPACSNGLACQNGTCMVMGGNTGDPCAKNTDCQGTKPVCITKDTQGIMWPGGYCTSTCNPQKNDPQTGINASCPGGTGICLGAGTSGSCETACTDMMGTMPCTRMGYSCFQGCEPTARSQCDPTKMG